MLSEFRKACIAGAILIACGGSATAQGVRDACFAGGGSVVNNYNGVSVTALESSTAQILEVMSANRLEAAIACPSGFSRQGSGCVQIAAQIEQPSSAAEPSRLPTRARGGKATPAPPQERARDGRSEVGVDRITTWSEAIADYERRSHHGKETQRTIGAQFGLDTIRKINGADVRFGATVGYSDIAQRVDTTHSTTGPVVYRLSDLAFPSDPELRTVRIPGVSQDIATDLSRRIRAANGGVVASYSVGQFFIDAVGRIEGADIRQRGRLTNSAGRLRGPGDPSGPSFLFRTGVLNPPTPAFDASGKLIPGGSALGCIGGFSGNFADLTDEERAQAIANVVGDEGKYLPTSQSLDGSTSSLSFILANTVGAMYDLGQGYFFEPTASYRYIYTNYDRSGAPLGLDDGYALRLEAGGKLSHIDVTNQGTVWINSIGLYAYSDVLVRGFVISSSGGSSTGSDEGELRGRALLQTTLQTADGFSFFGEVNSRFGDQYWSVGGKLGVRYEW